MGSSLPLDYCFFALKYSFYRILLTSSIRLLTISKPSYTYLLSTCLPIIPFYSISIPRTEISQPPFSYHTPLTSLSLSHTLPNSPPQSSAERLSPRIGSFGVKCRALASKLAFVSFAFAYRHSSDCVVLIVCIYYIVDFYTFLIGFRENGKWEVF